MYLVIWTSIEKYFFESQGPDPCNIDSIQLPLSSKTAQRKAFLPCLFWKMPLERSIVGNTLEEQEGLRHNGILKAPCSIMQSLFYNSADYVVDQTLRVSNHYLLDIWPVLLNSEPNDELPLAALSGDYMQAPVGSHSLSNQPGVQQARGREHRKKLEQNYARPIEYFSQRY